MDACVGEAGSEGIADVEEGSGVPGAPLDARAVAGASRAPVEQGSRSGGKGKKTTVELRCEGGGVGFHDFGERSETSRFEEGAHPKMVGP